MKKAAFLLALSILCAVLFSGCIYWEVSRSYELLYDISEIQDIAIYVRDAQSDPFQSAPLVRFAPEDFPEVISGLKSLPFQEGYLIMLLPAAVDPSFSYGAYILKITYTGGYEAISDCGYQKRRVNGEKHFFDTHYSCDHGAWDAFIQKYIQ